MFQFFWQNKLVPVVQATWDKPQKPFCSNNGQRITAQRSADSCKEDWSSRLQQSNYENCNTIQYDVIYSRTLKRWLGGQLSLAHGIERKK